jgi:hypothetical protein
LTPIDVSKIRKIQPARKLTQNSGANEKSAGRGQERSKLPVFAKRRDKAADIKGFFRFVVGTHGYFRGNIRYICEDKKRL